MSPVWPWTHSRSTWRCLATSPHNFCTCSAKSWFLWMTYSPNVTYDWEFCCLFWRLASLVSGRTSCYRATLCSSLTTTKQYKTQVMLWGSRSARKIFLQYTIRCTVNWCECSWQYDWLVRMHGRLQTQSLTLSTVLKSQLANGSLLGILRVIVHHCCSPCVSGCFITQP